MQFDSGTIPVVLHVSWMYNYAHTATAGLAWVFNNLNQTSSAALAERARRVCSRAQSACLEGCCA